MDYKCEICEDDGCDYCPDAINVEEYVENLYSKNIANKIVEGLQQKIEKGEQ